MLYFCAYFNMT